jgi:hypothetical protein
MSINLDELISSSNSVDDLLGALKSESAGATKSSAQLSQLYAAAEGVSNSGSWMDKLKEAVSPKSTTGTLQYDALYKKYYTDTLGSDQEPVSKEEFIKAIEDRKAKGTQRAAG